jgi:hypothetical protein
LTKEESPEEDKREKGRGMPGRRTKNNKKEEEKDKKE